MIYLIDAKAPCQSENKKAMHQKIGQMQSATGDFGESSETCCCDGMCQANQLKVQYLLQPPDLFLSAKALYVVCAILMA